MIYLIFVQYVKHRLQNARMFRIWFEDELREVYATNDFNIVRRWQ